MKEYSPLDYIKIDIANQFGKDKLSFPQRIAWVNSIKDLRSKTAQAEKPAQYLAAVYALEDALAGKPSGHLVGLDACSSGIAILGILIGCHETSRNTGIIGNKRMDMYSECTKAMNQIMGTSNEVARGEVKTAQMTHFYGSKAEPKRVFGDETEELMAFYQAQELVAPGACIMMRELLDSWQPYALEHTHTLPDGYVSKVPVLQKFKSKIEIDELDHASLTYIYEDNVGMEKGLAVAANMTHAVDGFLVRETARRCDYNEERLLEVRDFLKETVGIMKGLPMKELHPMEITARSHGFLSLRAVEFISEANVLDFTDDFRSELLDLIDEVLDYPSFPILTIHDEFKCHPNHMTQMRKVYRKILAELADSDVGECIIAEVRGDHTYDLTKLSTDLGDDIMHAEYFLS